MRFLDANVFIYAYCKPKRQLTLKEKQMKEHAEKIISGVSQGKARALVTAKKEEADAGLKSAPKSENKNYNHFTPII